MVIDKVEEESTMKIETVCGSIQPEKLEVTLPHEHILIDLRATKMRSLADKIDEMPVSRLRYLDSPVTMDILGKLRRGDIVCRDSMILNDEELMAEELSEFRKMGGSSVVEQTMPGCGRDPVGLYRISKMTGLNIIAVTGFYNHWSHPPYVKKMKVEDLKEHFIKELTEGIDDTGIKAGLIGECANTEPIPYHPEEQKVLTAAFLAQASMGCGFTLHPAKFDLPNKRMVKAGEIYLDMMEKAGANVNKFYLSHSDWFTWDMDYLRRILDRGATLLFDTFGMEYYSSPPYPLHRSPTDAERVAALVELLEQNYEKQLMMCQDICAKFLLKKYGGNGYSHVQDHIIPELKLWGVNERQIRTMMIDNPRRILAY